MSMYKKIALLSALLCTAALCASDIRPWLEVKPSCFLFSSSPLKDIYDNCFEIQGSASIPVRDCLALYGSIGYRKAHGNALNTCEKTSLTVVPIDIGIKPIFTFCEHFYSFFAMGPRFFYFNQHNNSPYVDCKIDGGSVGFFVNTGINVELTDCILLGIFGEYSYEKKKNCPKRPHVYSNGKVQMGGFALGGSVGCAF